ncbi:MAG: DUF2225 domain-containing protein [Deltaproteobacteria bacterium]
MDNSSEILACPLCLERFSHASNTRTRSRTVFGYGLDFRLVPRDCGLSSDIVTCPSCLFTCRVEDFDRRVPGQVKELVRSSEYISLFEAPPGEAHLARSWLALVSILESRGLNARDLGVTSLKGSWMARELGSLKTEQQLLAAADGHFDKALRHGLTKGDPGMVIYLLGEINRRREELLRAREMLMFLGNNPRYRYAALLLTVLIEEEDSTPYWSQHAPDQMELQSPRFKGLFPALRSIPPGKTEFYPHELSEQSEQPD